MKISLQWLNEFFPSTPAASQPSAKAADLRAKLPFLGLEIGGFQKLGEGIENVVVGLIEKAERHPQADRLQVCSVRIDAQKEPLQIVCGAPNARAGLKVAVATIGCVLPGNFKIQQSKIRGVESFGMLCSGKELGLGDESAGIMELPETAPLGASLVKTLGLNDEIWEVELTPDRADCLSHWGVAREVGRLIHVLPEMPEFEKLEGGVEVPLLSVEIQDSKSCPYYGALLFEGLQTSATPSSIKRVLEGLGHKSHNTIVDITNYVLQELGHPLHAFDADQIKGSKILVRRAKNGEKLKTLDGVERVLSSEDLIIADIEMPLALAGVMGGLDSGVSAKTTRVVLESALFDPAVIRSMAARHKIHSEASHRFERGVDPLQISRAAGRASFLIKKLSGARRRGSFIEYKSDAWSEWTQPQTLNFDLRAFKNTVGLETSAEEIAQAFKSIQISCQVKSPNVLKVEVPSHRLDLTREIDLIEEAARLIGYDKIPERYPCQTQPYRSLTRSLFERIQTLRRRVLETGLCELMPYCFVSDKEKSELPVQAWVTLANPLSGEWAHMRPNMSFGVLSLVARHAALGQLQGSFFDLGHVFSKRSGEGSAERSIQVKESLHLGWALMGRTATEHWSSDKKSEDRKKPIDFFDAKGIFERLAPDLSVHEGRWSSTQFVLLADLMEKPDDLKKIEEQAPWIPLKLLHPYRSAILLWPGKPPGQCVGFVGELHPQRKGDWLNLPTGLSLGVSVGEIRVIDDLLAEMNQLRSGKAATAQSAYGKIEVSRKLPVVERDIACVFPAGVLARDIDKAIRKSAGNLLLDLQCLDLYPQAEGRFSLAYRLLLQGQDHTLTDEEIQNCLKQVLSELQKSFKAELRA